MAQAAMVELRENGTEKVFLIHGDLEQGHLSEFARLMEQELKIKSDFDFVIDMDKCRFIDSGNLGVISHAHREISGRGRRLKLINVQKGVASTLSVTSLDRIFDIRLKDKPGAGK